MKVYITQILNAVNRNFGMQNINIKRFDCAIFLRKLKEKSALLRWKGRYAN